jgi:hypothetical protein
MFSNVGKKCFQLWCVLCAVQTVYFNILYANKEVHLLVIRT